MAQKTKRSRRTKLAFTKKKNLLDIRHQRYLNYFNIIAIVWLTSAFTIVWAFILQQITIGLTYAALIVDVVAFGTCLWIVHKELKNITRKIQKLPLAA